MYTTNRSRLRSIDEREDILCEKVPLDVDLDPPEQNTSSTTTYPHPRPSVRKPNIRTKERTA
jgi:hypothetical protein